MRDGNRRLRTLSLLPSDPTCSFWSADFGPLGFDPGFAFLVPSRTARSPSGSERQRGFSFNVLTCRGDPWTLGSLGEQSAGLWLGAGFAGYAAQLRTLYYGLEQLITRCVRLRGVACWCSLIKSEVREREACGEECGTGGEVNQYVRRVIRGRGGEVATLHVGGWVRCITDLPFGVTEVMCVIGSYWGLTWSNCVSFLGN
ncbi:hypothetical protein B0T10DRAFT_480088 [Thelonectria olida]|uniref:Uncharacterized protein n=1 Tax=Thelonectria olida TaxID=1576542 RepID=A0A9P8W9R3_9HYPO|nr:hypothetical protein B0T10DRAFT_480088 [Thelonectria olida]